ncbi:MAG: DUF1499 domain-containing protein [Candidatus Hydrogenedentales bacterium]
MLIDILSVVPLLVLLAGVLLAHTGVLSPLGGFGIFALSVPLGIVLAVIMVIGRSKGWVHAGAVPTTLCMMPLVFVAAGAAPGLKLPRINDIVTDTANPPRFVRAAELPENHGRDMEFPASFAAEIQRGYPDLKPIRVGLHSGDVRQVFDAAHEVAKGWEGWTITLADPEQGIVEGYAVTYLFRFRDDFVIQVRQEGDEAIVNMRSKSRDGKGDLGANARRIRNYLRVFQQKLGLTA